MMTAVLSVMVARGFRSRWRRPVRGAASMLSYQGRGRGIKPRWPAALGNSPGHVGAGSSSITSILANVVWPLGESRHPLFQLVDLLAVGLAGHFTPARPAPISSRPLWGQALGRQVPSPTGLSA